MAQNLVSPVSVDSRQKTPPSSVRVEELVLAGVPAQTATLDLGDYSWTVESEDGLVLHLVEEKLVPDLLNSAGDGRLSRFVQAEVGAHVVRALLVVGSYEYGVNHQHEHWGSDQIDNLLASIQDAGVIVLRAVTPTQACGRIASYWRYTSKGEHRTLDVPVRPRTSSYYLNPRKRDAVRLLMCLPGVGESRARAMLSFHGSVDKALYCLMNNKSCGADGVGTVIVKKAKVLLEQEFGS